MNHDRVGPAPVIAVDHAGGGDIVVLLHGVGGNRTNWHDARGSRPHHLVHRPCLPRAT